MRGCRQLHRSPRSLSGRGRQSAPVQGRLPLPAGTILWRSLRPVPPRATFRSSDTGAQRRNQGCGITKCATTFRTRITGTAITALRDNRPSQRSARGRNISPTMTVARSAKSSIALISDARTGHRWGEHTPGRLAEHAHPGRTGCETQRMNNPSSTTPAARTGERVVPFVLTGMSPDYRSDGPTQRRSQR